VNLWSTLVEGFESVAQPCTLPLLCSALIFALAAGRAAPLAVASVVVGMSLMAWARFSKIVTIDVIGFTAVIAGLAVAVSIILVAAFRRTNWSAVAAGSFVGGAVAAAAWRPCVGPRLADILNEAPDAPFANLLPAIAYVLGIAAIPAAFAALPIAVPRTADVLDRTSVAATGAALGVAAGALMAFGVWDSVLEELLARSSA
jgi:cytochrome c biogenesis protein CcdA